MSTKIYNAYRVNKGISIDKVMDLLKQARKQYHEEVTKYLVLSEERLKVMYEVDSLGGLVKEIKESVNSGINDTLNFSASVMVYLFEGRIYLQFFGLDSPLKTDIVGTLFEPICTDYHYQNQTDAWYEYTDEEYTKKQLKEFEKDYEERKRVWDGIYGDSWKPVEVGLVYEVFTSSDSMMVVFNAQEILRKGGKDG